MKMLNKIIGGGIAIAAVLAFSASTTQAATLVNPDFEQVGAPNTGNGWTVNPISLTSGPGGTSGVDQGWALFGGAAQSAVYAESGTYSLSETVAAGNNWATPGGYQIISGITPLQTYTFSVWALTDTVAASTPGALVQLGFELPTLVGGASTTAGPGTVGVTGSPTPGVWTQYSVTATAPLGYTDAIVYLMFQDFPAAAPADMYFDNASLTVVPEPSTLALLAMGLGLPFYFWRRRNS